MNNYKDIMSIRNFISLSRGEKVLLIGPNGAGKTTLLKLSLPQSSNLPELTPHIEEYHT